MSKKILIACEESQTTCRVFRQNGQEAYSCDIIKTSGTNPEWHIVKDCLKIINGNCRFKTQDGKEHYIEKWDLIIGHPPCTYLCNASAVRMFPGKKLNKERYKKMLNAKKFFLEIYNAKCNCICIENPIPLKIANLPPCSQIICPSLFGHEYTKRTCLWLKNLPPLIYTTESTKKKSFVFTRSGSKARSKSFDGISKAMYNQWNELI